MKDPTPALI